MKTHLAVGTYWSKTSNKANAPGRSFSFIPIRTESPLSMQRILHGFTIMIFVSLHISRQLPRDLWVEFSLFFQTHTAQGRQPCGQELTRKTSLLLSWNKTFILQLLSFTRLHPFLYPWLTAPKPPVREILSHSYWSVKFCKCKAQFLIVLYPSSLLWYICDTDVARGQTHLVPHFPEGYSIAIM